MAKAKTLAALAGLAGLAYAMRNKDKGMTPEQNDTLANVNKVSKMSDDSDTLARVNRNMSAGQLAADSTNTGVLKAITAPKTAPNDQAGNQGVLSSKSLTPRPKSAGMTGAQNTALANANKGMSKATVTSGKNPDYSNEGRSSTAPAAKNPNYSNEGRSSVAPTSTTKPQYRQETMQERAERFVDKRRAAQEEAKNTPPKARTDSPLGRKMESEVLNNMITNPPMKKGGAVKMASGGMTASRRADGIATKGKTRGKIC
jgi:hypothetical protein